MVEIIPPGNYPARFTWKNGHLCSEMIPPEIIPLGFYVESGLRMVEIIPPGNYPARFTWKNGHLCSEMIPPEIIPLGVYVESELRIA